jgi:hypothetical protein
LFASSAPRLPTARYPHQPFAPPDNRSRRERLECRWRPNFIWFMQGECI